MHATVGAVNVCDLCLCGGGGTIQVGFRTAQARVIAKWNNVSFNAAFTFKALMERMPLYFLVSAPPCTSTCWPLQFH